MGWTLSEDMTTENTIWKAWLEARKTRDIKDGFIFHSDSGIQYACNKMTTLFFYNKKITQSMIRKGNCWDNAVAYTDFWITLQKAFSKLLNMNVCIGTSLYPTNNYMNA